MEILSDEPRNIIYGLFCRCHPHRGIRYVGLTRRGFRDRWSGHLSDMKRKPNTPVYRWISKHGADQVAHVVLQAPPAPELSAAEIRWIATLREAGCDLLNKTDGGIGAHGLFPTAATRAKMSAAHRGDKSWTKRSPDKWAMIQALGSTPESRAKAIATTRARGLHVRPWTDERRATHSRAIRGDGHPKAKIDQATANEIRRRALAGETGQALAREYGVNFRTVSNIKLGKSWMPV